MNLLHVLFALVGAVGTFVCRQADRVVIRLEMAYISVRRWAVRDHDRLRIVPNHGNWFTAGSSERL
ncbi:hypothetical protein ABZ619_24785 [Streptomyces sp. NPDC007851]|uniref:hypothetical protein n=1 Tax=Streptomyces sp. NPDC007851 TaxID=3155008 RepID=UPI003400885A